MRARVVTLASLLSVTSIGCGTLLNWTPDGGLDAGHPDATNRTDSGDASPQDVPIDAPPAITRQLAPMSGARLSSQQPTLRWTLGMGATGGSVRLCRDRALTSNCTMLNGNTSAQPLTALTPGLYYWQL